MARRLKKRNIKLTIEYDGTNFHGWQMQDPRQRTVQVEIQRALAKIFKIKTLLIGSGRTDAGVHAQGQVANFQTTSTMGTEEIFRAINANLPEDITILEISEVPHNFHAQFKAKRKLYRYTILNRPGRCANHRFFCLHFPHKLDCVRLRQEAKALIGRHDFQAFVAADPAARRAGKKEKDTIRTIHRLRIQKKDDYIYIDVEADGFLYKMVRNIVGTLLKAGTNRLPPGSLKSILEKKDRNLAGNTAPAHGLCLLKVLY